MRTRDFLIVVGAVAGCGPSNRGGVANTDASALPGDSSSNGCGGATNCYSVYAHSDTMLYVVDVQAKTLNTIGPFNAPLVGTTPDTMTDLAVAPDNTIYVTSETALYTASPQDGHVTKVGSLSACGSKAVALTTTPDGKLWTGDYMGTVCQINTAVSPPALLPPITMNNGMALSGDFVAVADGTVFGTAYKKADGTGMGTQANNVLVKLDMSTGAVTQVGPTGFPKLFGVAFADGQVFGFTHDGTGRVVTIDPTTGAGTVFGTFTDPTTHMGISFGGAGVNSMVPIIE